jgi:hypothetical protein
MEERDPAPLERLRFGAVRTLNVRVGLLSGADASARVESWLRSKQVELRGDVLIITGRGKGSVGGIPVVREATRKTLGRLRRLGVVESFGEDTPGSFVVTLAPLRALLEAPARRRMPSARASVSSREGVVGLRAQTRDQLRRLATHALYALGIPDASEEMITAEMGRQFSILVKTAQRSREMSSWLDTAITRAIREYEDAE